MIGWDLHFWKSTTTAYFLQWGRLNLQKTVPAIRGPTIQISEPVEDIFNQDTAMVILDFQNCSVLLLIGW